MRRFPQPISILKYISFPKDIEGKEFKQVPGAKNSKFGLLVPTSKEEMPNVKSDYSWVLVSKSKESSEGEWYRTITVKMMIIKRSVQFAKQTLRKLKME